MNISRTVTEIAGEEYWTHKGDVKLFLWRKRAVTSTRGLPLVLVHGASLSVLPSFDLQVPGHPGHSMVDWFAPAGMDVWTLHHQCYARRQ